MDSEGAGTWIDVGPGVLARHYGELDLTVGLVIGEHSCLVVDTRGDSRQGAELAAAVRNVTDLPWSVALTHAHFDHSFGSMAFQPCPVWAHVGCRTELATNGERTREQWVQRYRTEGRPETADAIAASPIALPDNVVMCDTELDLGGRTVVLRPLGPAHTGHDLAVEVPDAAVVFTGDVVENGPRGSFTIESFGPDTVLNGWPAALDMITEFRPRTVVPGHGDPAGPDLVARQRAELAAILELAAALERGEYTMTDVLSRSPLPAEETRAALAAATSS